jgi:hypothetical protein
MAVRFKRRINQLHHVAAFLQSEVIGRKFTILPVEWKRLFCQQHRNPSMVWRTSSAQEVIVWGSRCPQGSG